MTVMDAAYLKKGFLLPKIRLIDFHFLLQPYRFGFNKTQ